MMLIATALTVLGTSRTAAAQGVSANPRPVPVQVDALTTTFAESLAFRLEAAPQDAVADAMLRYRVGDDEVVQRRRPSLTKAGDRRVVLEHRETVVRGQIPPASEIRWWWTLTHADGTQTTTPAKSTLYLDEHFAWLSAPSAEVNVWTYGPNDDLASRVTEASEAGLDRIAELTGDRPDRPINIVTYRTRTDMLPALVSRGAAYEQRLATLGARVAPDIVLLLTEKGYGGIEEILAHELSHTVLHLGFEESYLNAPLWLDEGLAMYSEGDLDSDDQRILDDATRDNQLMSLRSLTSFPGRAELVPLAYAESRDIVSFLIARSGPDAFRAFLDDLGGGDVTVDEALTARFGVDQLGLYQEYRAARALPPAQPARPEDAVASSRDAGGSRCLFGALMLPALLLVPALCGRLRL